MRFLKENWFKISLVVLGALMAPSFVFATSGACSSHGGVNCFAGSDWSGNVICNDGWVNSSVVYYNADECQTYNFIPVCAQPSGYGCTTENNYSAMRALYARSGALDFGVQNLLECRNQITKYQQDVQAYNDCWNNYTSIKPSISSQNPTIQSPSLTQPIRRNYGIDICYQLHGNTASYDYDLDKCTCNPDYFMSAGKCISKATLCPANSTYNFVANQCGPQQIVTSTLAVSTTSSLETSSTIQKTAVGRITKTGVLKAKPVEVKKLTIPTRKATSSIKQSITTAQNITKEPTKKNNELSRIINFFKYLFWK